MQSLDLPFRETPKKGGGFLPCGVEAQIKWVLPKATINQGFVASTFPPLLFALSVAAEGLKNDNTQLQIPDGCVLQHPLQGCRAP